MLSETSPNTLGQEGARSSQDSTLFGEPGSDIFASSTRSSMMRSLWLSCVSPDATNARTATCDGH